MRLLFPVPTSVDIDDDALIDLYRPADRDQPRLRVNFVTSLDGAVTIDGHPQRLSGAADKLVFGIVRMLCDALLVGAETLRHDNYGPLALGARRHRLRADLGLPPDPPLVVVSARLALSPDHPALADAPVRPIVLTPASSPPERRAALAPVADVIVVGDQSVDFTAALAELHDRGLRQLLCEGGPHVFAALTAADLVDELCVTVSPLLAGGEPGRISAGMSTAVPRRLTIRHILVQDNVLLLRYAR